MRADRHSCRYTDRQCSSQYYCSPNWRGVISHIITMEDITSYICLVSKHLKAIQCTIRSTNYSFTKEPIAITLTLNFSVLSNIYCQIKKHKRLQQTVAPSTVIHNYTQLYYAIIMLHKDNSDTTVHCFITGYRLQLYYSIQRHTHTTVLRLCGICPGKPG